MKKVVMTILAVLFALILIAGGLLGVRLVHKYMPSNTVKKDTEWLGVSGDEVALLYQDALQETIGLYADGQVYLPLDWVNEHLNERFYWDTVGEQLIYTLPDAIVYAGLETVGSNGASLIKKVGETVYLQTGIVVAYTDIQMEIFAAGEAKRIFIDDRWQDVTTAAVGKDSAVRELGGIKSDILTKIPRGDAVFVLAGMDVWSLVRTADGFLGYVENKNLDEAETKAQVSTFQQPVYTNISFDEEISMVWHQVTIGDANQAFQQMIEGTKGVNVVAPTWFMLTDNQGNYDSLASQAYVDLAHEKGLQVWAVLDNFNRGDMVRSEILFSNTDSRRQLISNLMEDVAEYGLDGINLDIEGIKPEAGPHYVQFVRELSVECRREGVVLSIDTYVPSSYTSFYNRAELGQVTDYVVIMGYDEHTAGAKMGSVSSFGYIQKAIADTLREVPKEKIICGLPFYTRLWQEEDGTTTSKALGIAAAKDWIAANQVELYWQEELGQYYGEKAEGDIRYYIWMEEEQSLEKKLEEVRRQGLAGSAYWKLGLESASIWDVVRP